VGTVKNFIFYNPTKVYFGAGVNSGIGEKMAGDGIERALLLYGGSSVRSNGVYDAVTGSLRAAGIKFIECGGVKPNPVMSKVREAAGIVRAEGLEAIAAVGGGSVIDSAKGAAAAACYEGDAWDFYMKKSQVKRALPVYAVATLSATASEMNSTSVVTNEETGMKVGFSDAALHPRATFLDPSVQFSVPRGQSADGGIDAMCHVMETYFDGTPDVELLMEYSEGLLRSLIELTPAVMERPRDYEARAQFAWAALSALNGTTWAGHSARGDFASHAMGHALSAKYDAVHGETLSIVMPFWMEYVTRDNLAAFSRFARRVFGAAGGTDEEAAAEGVARLRAFFKSLGAPTRLRDIGVPEGDLPELAAKAAGASPIGVLRKLDASDVLAIYRSAY
jgi:alcohol dehydrogenase YqhD (iron-dependent ADH family)